MRKMAILGVAALLFFASACSSVKDNQDVEISYEGGMAKMKDLIVEGSVTVFDFYADW